MQKMISRACRIMFSALWAVVFFNSCTDGRTQAHLSPPGDKTGRIKKPEGPGKNPFLDRRFNSVKELIDDWRARNNQLWKSTDGSSDSAGRRHHESERLLVMQRNEALFRYMMTAPKSPDGFSGFVFLVYTHTGYDVPLTRIDSLFNTFPDSLKKSVTGRPLRKKMDEILERDERSSYTLSVLNVALKDTAGNTIRLNELSSRYILIDFWASWCLPCRIENRKLISEKQKIERGGHVSIVAFSLDDKPGKWKKATRDDKMNCLSVSDGKAFDSPFVQAFGLKKNNGGIPYNVLIDKEGRILAANTWGEKLQEVIAALPQQ